MFSKCNVNLVGYLGQDAEMKPMTGFTKFIFNVATTDRWRDRQTGDLRENTIWHRVEANFQTPSQDGQITVMASALKKGAPVIIDGTLKNREWKEGNKWIHWIDTGSRGINLLGRNPADGISNADSQNQQDNASKTAEDEAPF